jgi:hypothetical protein
MTTPAPNMKPPLLPAETLRRVLRVARIDGMSVLVVAGGFALVSAAFRDVPGAAVGLLIAAAGAIELHGVTLLRIGNPRGMDWLVSSQLYLMVTIFAYVAYHLMRPDIAWMLPYVTGEAAEPIQQAAQEMGLTVNQFLLESLRKFYLLVAALTLVYQGGMIAFYLRRKSATLAAISEDEPQ